MKHEAALGFYVPCASRIYWVARYVKESKNGTKTKSVIFFFFSSSTDFPYPTPFRNFPGFPPSPADRSSAVAAAVGMLPSMGQPASLAAFRNSSAAAALGLHQVSMMDQVRQEHHRQQQQHQQQQQHPQQPEDGISCTRELAHDFI